MIDYPGNFSAA